MTPERITQLFVEQKHSVVEFLLQPRVFDSLSNYYWYLQAMFCAGSPDFPKIVATHAAFLADPRSVSLLTTADVRCNVQFVYLQALVKAGNAPLAIEEGKAFLQSILPTNGLDRILTCPTDFLIGMSSFAKVGLSGIAFLLSTLSSPSETGKKLLALALLVDADNFDALRCWCDSDVASKEEKQVLVNRIRGKISNPQVAEFLQVALGNVDIYIAPSLVPDTLMTEQGLRVCLRSSSVEAALATLSSNEESSLVFKDIRLIATIAPLLYLKADPRLFTLASYFMKHYPGHPNAFFVAGLYYLSLPRLDIARKFFSRSTTNSLHGWLAYGLAFALSDESSHAINAFRTATLQHPQAVLPWLYLAIECIRTSELKLAQSYLVSALDLCADDADNNRLYRRLILNEIAVICLKANQFDVSMENFKLCCDGAQLSSATERTQLSVFFANLGYSLVKLRDMDSAINSFDAALRGDPMNGNALAGMGFCQHCRGSLGKSIDLYNQALTVVRNRKIENVLNNLIQLAINEFAHSAKHNFDMMVEGVGVC